MNTVTIVLLVILAVLIIAVVALYFLGKKAQKRQAEQQQQIDAMKQTVSMLIIDKKRMKITEANLPKVVTEQIQAIVNASIPVVAHLGMTPQSVNTLGGFKVQGKSLEAARKLLADAKAVEEAGAFAVVLECVPEKLAALVTKTLSIPTIGIGAGAGCDGQVLVYQDMLGMFSDYQPKFVRKFADAGTLMRDAFLLYQQEVQNGNFPAKEHNFAISDDVMKQLEQEELQ